MEKRKEKEVIPNISLSFEETLESLLKIKPIENKEVIKKKQQGQKKKKSETRLSTP